MPPDKTPLKAPTTSREKQVSHAADPYTGLELVELSHEWGHGVPSQPGHADVLIYRSVKHAEHGVMAQRLRMVMHSSTHLNAPIHLIQRGIGVGSIPLNQLFGNGVVLNIPKARWELISPEDLEAAGQTIESGDMVVINTGWHHKYADSLEYFGEAPGLSKAAAKWLVDRKISLLAIDTPHVDHPLATNMAAHRGGPKMKRLPKHYQDETGRDPMDDHPDWNIAHRTLLAAGIPTIENVGGEVDSVNGKRLTLHACPWRWLEGDACVVRFVAMLDPSGNCRIESGEAA
jgi:kynurenine formamidase